MENVEEDDGEAGGKDVVEEDVEREGVKSGGIDEEEWMTEG